MIAKLRTAEKAFNEIKKMDPETSLSLTALRRMIRNGEIRYLSVGNKKLIDLDETINKLAEMSSFNSVS